MTRCGEVSREEGVSLALRSRYGDREVRCFLVTGPSSVRKIDPVFLELKVSLFTSKREVRKGFGSCGRYCIHLPCFDSVCDVEHRFFLASLGALDVAFGMRRRKP